MSSIKEAPKKSWRHGLETQLIQFYARNPCLWNKDCQEFKDNETRKSLLHEFADKTLDNRFTVSQIKLKFKRMKAFFYANHKRVEESLKSGKVFNPKYVHYKSLKFLLADGSDDSISDSMLSEGLLENVEIVDAPKSDIIKSINICRVCLTDDNELQAIDLKVFKFCTGINLIEKSYSSKICEKCEKVLFDLNDFKKRCINNDKAIESFYSSTYSTEIKEEPLEIFTEPISTFIVTMKEEAPETEEPKPIPEVIPPVKLKGRKKTKPKEKVKDTKRTKLCPECGKMVYSRYISTHLRTHIKKDPNIRYPCDLCDQTFAIKQNVALHKQAAHIKLKKYACDLCDEKFIYFNTKRRHMANVHETIEKKYVCNICGKKYLTNSELEKHMTIHTNEKPIQCELCPKRFRSKNNLTRHMLTHTKEKNFKCEFCEKLFSKKSSLSLHERIHTGFRDYVCPVCSKDFIQNHVMRAHCRSNHPEYELPPPGTIVSQRYLKKLKEVENENKVG